MHKRLFVSLSSIFPPRNNALVINVSLSLYLALLKLPLAQQSPPSYIVISWNRNKTKHLITAIRNWGELCGLAPLLFFIANIYLR